jgi:hypothetical protein
MAVYLGQEGYCLDFEFREGKQHSTRLLGPVCFLVIEATDSGMPKQR